MHGTRTVTMVSSRAHLMEKKILKKMSNLPLDGVSILGLSNFSPPFHCEHRSLGVCKLLLLFLFLFLFLLFLFLFWRHFIKRFYSTFYRILLLKSLKQMAHFIFVSI